MIRGIDDIFLQRIVISFLIKFVDINICPAFIVYTEFSL